MSTLDDGVGPNVDHAIRLCNLLGLDPAETSSIRINIEAGAGAVVEWTGRRRVPLSRIADALGAVLTDDDDSTRRDTSTGPTWQLPADPWKDEPPC